MMRVMVASKTVNVVVKIITIVVVASSILMYIFVCICK